MSLSAALRHFGDFGSQSSFVGPTRLLCDVKDDEDDFPLIEPDSEVRTYKTEFETELRKVQLPKRRTQFKPCIVCPCFGASFALHKMNPSR
jgi:hypothetical protein